MIPVTKPFLPPQAAYQQLVKEIFDRNWLTNNGPLVNQLELNLKEYLKVKHLLFVSNGTIALQLAIRALDLTGEIITTPFSYVATTSSIVWEHAVPVFADIDPKTLNIDPDEIEKRITVRTSGILATHVYGNPCAVEAIQEIADQHKLKVIYDAAHAFGVTRREKSIFEYGDISTTSFHATKLFHTTEGGAVITRYPELLKTMAYMRNFGHDGPEKFTGVGINGKNSEFHAAMGICNLPYLPEILSRRKHLCAYYDKALTNLRVTRPECTGPETYNYAYYPVIFESEEVLLNAVSLLNQKEIFPRRYFYPTLSSLPYVSTADDLPQAKDISKRVLCLPLYHELTEVEIDMIARLLLRSQNY